MSNGTESCLAAAPAITSSGEPGLALALLKLAKPGIVFAEVLAGLAGMLLVSSWQSAATFIFPVLIAIAMAAAGAAMLNNILDADADKRMSRLASRSRALEIAGSGRVLVIALLLMGSGIVLATFTAPTLATLLLTGGCLSYLLLYTAWLKRRSPWGVLAGCIPGALPPLIGAAAVSGTITAPPMLLAIFVFIWQLPHFWLLALECRNQYAQAGIPVLPVSHGGYLTRILTLTTTALLLPITCAIGQVGSLSSVYLTVACGAGITFLFFCARCLFQTHDFRQGFRASLAYIVTIFGAICVESLFR